MLRGDGAYRLLGQDLEGLAVFQSVQDGLVLGEVAVAVAVGQGGVGQGSGTVVVPSLAVESYRLEN